MYKDKLKFLKLKIKCYLIQANKRDRDRQTETKSPVGNKESEGQGSRQEIQAGRTQKAITKSYLIFILICHTLKQPPCP